MALLRSADAYAIVMVVEPVVDAVIPVKVSADAPYKLPILFPPEHCEQDTTLAGPVRVFCAASASL